MDYDDESPNVRALSLRQIELFRAIMMTGFTSEAARALYGAQPSVSRVLQVTGSRLGFPLLERARGRLMVTLDSGAHSLSLAGESRGATGRSVTT